MHIAVQVHNCLSHICMAIHARNNETIAPVSGNFLSGLIIIPSFVALHSGVAPNIPCSTLVTYWLSEDGIVQLYHCFPHMIC